MPIGVTEVVAFLIKLTSVEKLIFFWFYCPMSVIQCRSEHKTIIFCKWNISCDTTNAFFETPGNVFCNVLVICFQNTRWLHCDFKKHGAPPRVDAVDEGIEAKQNADIFVISRFALTGKKNTKALLESLKVFKSSLSGFNRYLKIFTLFCDGLTCSRSPGLLVFAFGLIVELLKYVP